MSMTYELMPAPDWATTTTVRLPDGGGQHDAAGWAAAIFDVQSVPIWVKGLFGVRILVARMLGLPPASSRMLEVSEVRGDEALIETDDRHLRFVAGVRVADRLLHVTTAVQLKGWRGQLYFLPVRFLHDPITRSMMESAARRT